MTTAFILIASKPLRYNAREMQVGEEFRANPRDARLLVAVGRASFKYTSAMRANSPQVLSAPSDEQAEPRKRSYKRRDMTAEAGEAQPLSLSPEAPAPRELGVLDSTQSPEA